MVSPSAVNVPLLTGFQRLFYIVTPNESKFASVDEVPNYVLESTPAFFMLIALETIVLWFQGKPLPRIDDAVSSVSAGLISRLPSVFIRAVELIMYIHVWENYRIAELPWDSSWTWLLCLIGVDFAYYWVHRCGHEVNFMWAAHQVHHSSEDYNLTTALRQSVLQNYSSWIFYMPLGLFIPPSVFLVHTQFNLLYQFWIHTEVVGWLGPLEYIINTPSAHRVHHGRNRYCIDKNYGGTFIFFDIIFGTYAAEQRDHLPDKVVYGLVHPLESRNPFYIQTCHWQYILSLLSSRKGMRAKLATLLNGPGWDEGKPRLGNIEDIPDITYPQPKYTAHVPVWYNIYAVVHFIISVTAQQILLENKAVVGTWFALGAICFILLTLTCIGSLFDQRYYAVWMELVRCTTATILVIFYFPSIVTLSQFAATAILITFSSSSLLWILVVMRHLTAKDDH